MRKKEDIYIYEYVLLLLLFVGSKCGGFYPGTKNEIIPRSEKLIGT